MRHYRFQCENCGTEVSFSDKACRNCKQLFSGVRCPRCSFAAAGRLFLVGCPNCGYGGAEQDRAFTAVQVLSLAEVDLSARRGARPNSDGRPTPAWVYLLFGIILTAAIVCAAILIA